MCGWKTTLVVVQDFLGFDELSEDLASYWGFPDPRKILPAPTCREVPSGNYATLTVSVEGMANSSTNRGCLQTMHVLLKEG